jgi:hypothetical protein
MCWTRSGNHPVTEFRMYDQFGEVSPGLATQNRIAPQKAH